MAPQGQDKAAPEDIRAENHDDDGIEAQVQEDDVLGAGPALMEAVQGANASATAPMTRYPRKRGTARDRVGSPPKTSHWLPPMAVCTRPLFMVWCRSISTYDPSGSDGPVRATSRPPRSTTTRTRVNPLEASRRTVSWTPGRFPSGAQFLLEGLDQHQRHAGLHLEGHHLPLGVFEDHQPHQPRGGRHQQGQADDDLIAQAPVFHPGPLARAVRRPALHPRYHARMDSPKKRYTNAPKERNGPKGSISFMSKARFFAARTR